MSVSASRLFWAAGDAVWMAFEDDGSLWVSDNGNQRAVHMAADGKKSWAPELWGLKMGFRFEVRMWPSQNGVFGVLVEKER